jgi:hypothetical protein
LAPVVFAGVAAFVGVVAGWPGQGSSAPGWLRRLRRVGDRPRDAGQARHQRHCGLATERRMSMNLKVSAAGRRISPKEP